MIPTLAVGVALFVLFAVALVLTVRTRSLGASLQAEMARAELLETQLENAAKAQKEAESANLARDQLATMAELSATIAHEVRNPLSVIGNAIATLRHKNVTAEDHVVLLTILEEESARLNRLMTDLVSFSKPVSLELVPIRLMPIVERALATLPGYSNTPNQGRIANNIEVEVSEPEPTDVVLGDKTLLAQVFENLIGNAVQAIGPSGGKLIVRLLPHDDPETPGVDVAISDSGKGMDAAVRDRAKLPFFSTKPGKAGLGLAIVMRFVQAHGGKLEITSAIGKGTSVRVFLPKGALPQTATFETTS